MSVPTNPFDAAGRAISKELFVGREEVLGAFREFLTIDTDSGRNVFWIVSGSRGQGKSSLFEACQREVADMGPHYALGSYTWPDQDPAPNAIARELFDTIVMRPGEWSPVNNFTRWRHTLSRFLPDLSIDLRFFKFSLNKYFEKIKDGWSLIKQLSICLRPEAHSVIILIDEVSTKPDVTVEHTKRFAKSLSDQKLEINGKRLNILTVVFVQPQHSRFLAANNGGPRASTSFSLSDFSETEVEVVVRKGLAIANASLPSNSGVISSDLADVACEVRMHTGGVPTLTVGLLHDAYKQMTERIQRTPGEHMELLVTDVKSALNRKSSEMGSRLSLFTGNFSLPGGSYPANHNRVLLKILAGENFSSAPIKIKDLESKLTKSIGKATPAINVISPVLIALQSSGFATLDDNGREVTFRGEVLRKSLANIEF